MPTTPRALGRAKAITTGAMLLATVATGGVALHLADARTSTTAAASTAGSDSSGTSSDSAATTAPSTDDDASSGTSGTTSNGFSSFGPVSSGSGPAQSSTNGS
jgi:hypothetical protein